MLYYLYILVYSVFFLYVVLHSGTPLPNNCVCGSVADAWPVRGQRVTFPAAWVLALIRLLGGLHWHWRWCWRWRWKGWASMHRWFVATLTLRTRRKIINRWRVISLIKRSTSTLASTLTSTLTSTYVNVDRITPLKNESHLVCILVGFWLAICLLPWFAFAAQVKPYGSFVTGLSLPWSDLDLVICLPKVCNTVVRVFFFCDVAVNWPKLHLISSTKWPRVPVLVVCNFCFVSG